MIFRIWATLALMLFGANAQALEVENKCYANAWESCYLVLTGEIGPDAVAIFETEMKVSEGANITIHSDGGDPNAAIALGRLIRAKGYATEVGQWSSNGPVGGVCRDACLYVLAAGVARHTSDGGKVYFDGIDPAFGTGPAQDASIVRATQFLIDMGVDPALLLREPSDAALSQDDLNRFGVDYTPPAGFGHFEIEPYKDGVIAASKRLDAPYIYDRVEQLTVFCRDGDVHFMMTALGDFMADSGGATMRFWTKSNADEGVEIDVDRYKTWVVADSGYVQFSISPDLIPALDDVTSMQMRFSPGRAFGGVHFFGLQFTARDRDMLSAAFRYCI